MSSSEQPFLFEGERLSVVNNAPTLTYFRKADPAKPLVVCIPGFGRIFYGGHNGGDPADFTAHWFFEHAYSFPAISYPLASNPAVMEPSRPGFTACEWGEQAAEITRRVIEEDKVSDHVILLLWSMGGTTFEPYSMAAKKLGFQLDLAVALAATPAMRGIRDVALAVNLSNNGYACLGPRRDQYFLSPLGAYHDLDYDEIETNTRAGLTYEAK